MNDKTHAQDWEDGFVRTGGTRRKRVRIVALRPGLVVPRHTDGYSSQPCFPSHQMPGHEERMKRHEERAAKRLPLFEKGG